MVTGILTDAEISTMMDSAATRGSAVIAIEKIQLYWTVKLARDVKQRGLSTHTAKNMLFSDLSAEMRDPTVLKTMKNILNRVCVLTADGVRICPGSEETEHVNVRVFMYSFLIVHHSDNVFVRINAVEEELIKRSRAMLKVFDKMCLAILSSRSMTDLRNAAFESIQFRGLLYYYLKAFQAWRLPDESKLIARMEHAINSLYDASDHLAEEDQDCQQLRG
jgi:hypothetical protein